MARSASQGIRFSPAARKLFHGWLAASRRLDFLCEFAIDDACTEFWRAAAHHVHENARAGAHFDRGLTLMEQVVAEAKRPRPRNGAARRLARRAEAAFIRADDIADRDRKRSDGTRGRGAKPRRGAAGAAPVVGSEDGHVVLEVATPDGARAQRVLLAPAKARALAKQLLAGADAAQAGRRRGVEEKS